MDLLEAIKIRKSTRKYKEEDVSLELQDKILAFCENTKKLYSDILTKCVILSKKDIKCILPFVTNQTIVLYSEEKEGYLENAGFIMQQVDLYLKTLGLGSCWLGMGKTKEELSNYDNLKYVIMLTFGYPDGELARSESEFKRMSLNEISDIIDDRLEVARLAPSSVNSQPWYFTHVDDIIHVYRMSRGLIKIDRLEKMNQIDIGIALCHLYVAYPNTFTFEYVYNTESLKNGTYVGSVRI